MVHGKGEITFPTAQIVDDKRSVFGQKSVNVVNKLQKPVDLPVFRPLFVKDPPALVGDAEMVEKCGERAVRVF